MKRILCLILVATLIISLAGCTEEAKSIVSQTPGQSQTPEQSQAPTQSQATGDSTIEQWKYPVATVNGTEVFADELRFQIVSLISNYTDYYGYVDWDETIDYRSAEIFFRDEAFRNTLIFRAVEELSAELSVELSAEEEAALRSDIESYAESYGGVDEFYALLASDAISPELYYYIAEKMPSLYTKLFDHLYTDTDEYTDADVHKFYEENYYTSRHIMISLYDESGNNVTEEQKQASYSRMQDAIERFNNGEMFDTIMLELNEDYYLEGSMTFHKDDMMTEYVDTTKALRNNGISGIEEISDTYIIIQRLSLDEAYFDENIDSLRERYLQQLFSDLLDEYIEANFTVEKLDAYGQVDVVAIYDEYDS